jgi:hypothetical protein
VSTLARALSWFLQPAAHRPDDPPRPPSPGEVTSAAVLGRPGEAEPVAAGLALALSRRGRTRAATVAVLAQPSPAGPPVHERPGGGWAAPASAGSTLSSDGPTPPASAAGESSRPADGWAPPGSAAGESLRPGEAWAPPVSAAGEWPGGEWAPRGSVAGESPRSGDASTPPGSASSFETSPAPGGSRAARRLVARLGAHGLPARARGRLAWVALPVAGGPVAARRAIVAGAPAVLAVTAPRTTEIDAVLAEQDLMVLVAAEPDGPLARLASPPAGGPPLAVVRPLRRGPARSLACAGLAAPRELRGLVSPSDEEAA